MSVTGYRQAPHPGHDVQIVENHSGRSTYRATCRTCGWAYGPVNGYVGPVYNAARRHIDGVKCCESAP